MGRSSFAVPWPVHLHAFVFFGWTALYVTQNAMVATGRVDVHRRLGRLAAIWVPAMIVVGLYMSLRVVRLGKVPFFFEPAYFLFMTCLTLCSFAGLIAAAVVNRRRTEWHRRLMFCGMAMLTSPGWGRLLPMPLLIPWAGWVAFSATLLFPIAGIIADLRRNGRVHPAWWWGMGIMIGTELLVAPCGQQRAWPVRLPAGHRRSPGSGGGAARLSAGASWLECFSYAETAPARSPTRPPNSISWMGGRVGERAGAAQL